ncbi:MAG: sigma-70 family RNA polymerase sigma factor [Bacteroidota bacterium]
MIITNGGNSEDAEDIFQEALVVLCMNVKKPDFVLTSKLSTYIYSICRFMWKDELKKRNKMVFSYIDTITDTIDENALTAIQEEEQLKIAESVVKSLGDRCKELLELFYSGKMKLKEIAEKMGYSSENTAKNQKYKCIETAKKNLKEMNGNVPKTYTT